MKFIVTFVYLLFCAVAAHGQVENTSEQVVVSISPNETVVHTDAKGVLHVTVAREDVLELHARGFVQYGDFGASGDGKTDDIDAIAAAHAFANQQDLPVKADEEATYHIGERSVLRSFRPTPISAPPNSSSTIGTFRTMPHRSLSLLPVCSRWNSQEYPRWRRIRKR